MLSKDATELNDHSDFSAEQSIQVRALTAGYMLIIRGRRRRRLVPLAASQPARGKHPHRLVVGGRSPTPTLPLLAGWMMWCTVIYIHKRFVTSHALHFSFNRLSGISSASTSSSSSGPQIAAPCLRSVKFLRANQRAFSALFEKL